MYVQNQEKIKALLTEKFMDILKFTVAFFFMEGKEEVGVG